MSDTLNQRLADSKKPYWIWGPLIFSSFYFLPLFFNFNDFTITAIFGSTIVYLVFILLYRQAVFSQGEKVIYPLIATLLLCILGSYFTSGTQSLFGYIAYFVGFNFSFKKSIFGFIVIIISIFIAALLFDLLDVFYIVPAIFISLGLLFFGSFERKDRIFKQKEARSQETIEELAAIAERERIARDLHDLIGHSLTSISLKADLAEKLININEVTKAQHEIAAVAKLSRATLSEVRQVVSGLKTQGLKALLINLKKELEQHHFTVAFHCEIAEIPTELESDLVCIFKEAITNILRHSQGNQVKIAINQENNEIYLSIYDDGVSQNLTQGNGLIGITERCKQLNAKLKIKNDVGFSISVQVPIIT
ncbi:MAG: sensor histidine kinase [Colwellia sp.]